MKRKTTLRNLKTAIVAGLSISIISNCIGITASAVNFTRLVDNDPTSSSGNSMYQSGFSYITNSSCYNGDARRASCSSSNYYYWIHARTTLGSVKTVTVKLQLYLNHSTFNDPAATYYVLTDGTMSSVLTLNQDTAPAGWGSTYTKSLSNCTVLGEVLVTPSNSSGRYCGADGVSVSYSYT